MKKKPPYSPLAKKLVQLWPVYKKAILEKYKFTPGSWMFMEWITPDDKDQLPEHANSPVTTSVLRAAKIPCKTHAHLITIKAAWLEVKDEIAAQEEKHYRAALKPSKPKKSNRKESK